MRRIYVVLHRTFCAALGAELADDRDGVVTSVASPHRTAIVGDFRLQ